MRLSRRRFLMIAGVASVLPSAVVAKTHRWRGRALGAECEITLHGDEGVFNEVVKQTQIVLRDVTKLFSLYEDTSSLSRLNRDGFLNEPDSRFHDLLDAINVAFEQTDGLFDPSIQPLWKALFEGRSGHALSKFVGWNKVTREGNHITLGASQALTFNGIAQGFATDLIRQKMVAAGVVKTLINMGEYSAIGGPWKLGIADPVFGTIGHRTLHNNAIATSSPAAMRLTDSQSHILHPHKRSAPLWSTVSVEAKTATTADALSTAFCHAPLSKIREIATRADGVNSVTLINNVGDVVTL
ncbi:MAG: FAD:protein FMN transferase [Hyphomicrobiales bacterium]